MKWPYWNFDLLMVKFWSAKVVWPPMAAMNGVIQSEMNAVTTALNAVP